MGAGHAVDAGVRRREDEKRAAGQPLSDLGEQAVLRHGISVLEDLLRSQTEKENSADWEAGKQPDVRLPRVDLHRGFGPGFPGTRNSGISCGGGVSALTW